MVDFNALTDSSVITEQYQNRYINICYLWNWENDGDFAVYPYGYDENVIVQPFLLQTGDGQNLMTGAGEYIVPSN